MKSKTAISGIILCLSISAIAADSTTTGIRGVAAQTAKSGKVFEAIEGMEVTCTGTGYTPQGAAPYTVIGYGRVLNGRAESKVWTRYSNQQPFDSGWVDGFEAKVGGGRTSNARTKWDVSGNKAKVFAQYTRGDGLGWHSACNVEFDTPEENTPPVTVN